MHDQLDEICSALPGAVRDRPFGPGIDAWKVGGKIFALGSGSGVSLKAPDPETAAFLMEIGVARPAPYLPRGGWFMLPVERLADGTVTPGNLAGRVAASHARVIAGLARQLRPAGPS